MRLVKFVAFVVSAFVWMTLVACQPVMPEADGGQEVAATSVPEEAPVAEVGSSVPYTSVAGFEVSLPQGWGVQDDPGGFMLLASDPLLLELESLVPIPDGVLMIFLNMAKAELPDLPIEALLGMFVDSQQPASAEPTSGPDVVEIGGQEAIRVSGSGEAEGTPFAYLAAAIGTETRLGRVFAVMPQAREAELRPLVEGVIESLVVSEPIVEPLDLSAIEGEITPGQPVTAELTPDAPMIWRFTGTAGQMIVATARPTETLDIVLSVVDSAGAPLFAVGEADSDGEGGAESRLAILPADGDYYVVVRGFTGGSGNFQVSIDETEVVAPVASPEELVGTWGQPFTYLRVDEDGTFRLGWDLEMLESEPVYQGSLSITDGQITIGRNEAGDFCADTDGTYTGIWLAGGEIVFQVVEDECPRRAYGLNELVLPPVE